MEKNQQTIISFSRKLQLEDKDIHLLQKQVFAPISYLVTTPSTCSMVDAGQPLGSGLSYHECTCTILSQIFSYI